MNDEWQKGAPISDCDVGSEGGGSTGTDSHAWNARNFVTCGSAERPTWIPADEEKAIKKEAGPRGGDAVPPMEDGAAHAFEASASEGAPGDRQEEDMSSPELAGKVMRQVRDLREALQGLNRDQAQEKEP